ncbi:MAG TPA: hypothetical protein VEJ67_01770 [Candidatus Cybelea sp.]|nr:hypothetical protein [Candidatus Cybelea sp.]
MTEPLASSDPGQQKRRSTRIVQAVPITVTGVDALGQPFKERTTTTMVNCHGCKYQSKHYVPKNATVTLEIPRPEPVLPPRHVQGRVVWVQRPRTVRELFQIGLEFDIAGNVWGIAFPPDDWFAAPGEEAAESASIQTAEKPAALKPSGPVATAFEKIAEKVQGTQPTPPTPAAPPSPTASALAPSQQPAPAPPDQKKIHVVPSAAAPTEEVKAALDRHMSKLVTNAKEALDKSVRHEVQTAVNDEMAVVRQQLDAQLHDAVERAIRTSMDRVSESTVKKVVHEAASRTEAIMEEARKASESSTGQLDAKVRRAVEQAVAGAAQEAAREAAQQAAALNLKDAVDQAVEQAITNRESRLPSLAMLTSPEAAQKQIGEWKKKLEETAEGIRAQSLERTQADAAFAAERWQAEFQSAMKGASEKLSEQLAQASQAALETVQQEATERHDRLRAALDETLIRAQSSVASLGAGLAEERARAELAAQQFQETARAALERTRRDVENLVAEQVEDIGRKADRAIAERAQKIDPLIESAARRTADRLSAELDQAVTAKLEDARRAAAEFAVEQQRAEQSRESVRQQIELASSQAERLRESIRDEIHQATGEAAQVQEQIREHARHASEAATAEALERIKRETAQYPAEFEKSCRDVLSKAEAEFEQKATAAEHATYEALLKASEWYQKKAHTTMQSSLEKAVEQSSAVLRDRAAEISSLVASELDHYRRTYLEHSQAEITEAAKELVEAERDKLNETADIANATFADRVRRVTEESLRRFEHSSRETFEKALSDMEFSREGALSELQKKIDERILLGVEQAKTQLASHLEPFMEAMEMKRQTQQREWMEELEKSSNESMEQYKARLENATNSWLLGAATTLGQHSQAVLDTLAKAAERRLRETCRDVLAGMGETLKSRMMGLSTDFTKDETDDEDPPKK